MNAPAKITKPAMGLRWCASCDENVVPDAGICRGCDAVVDPVAAADMGDAEAFAEDRWTPRITINLAHGTGSYGAQP